MISRILALALLTSKEGIRDRALYGIFLFALFALGLNIAVAGFFMQDLGKVTVDMNLAALSFSGLLLVFFICINLMAKDIDKKTIHLVLSKPFSRTEYIWGKYIGLLSVVLFAQAILLLFSCSTIACVQTMYSEYFDGFNWSIFFIAVFFIYMQEALLCAIVVFFSAITSTSFITLIFSIACYVVGNALEEVVFYLRTQSATQEVVASAALQNILGKVTWLVPNFAAFDLKIQAAHGLALDWSQLAITFGYGVLYVIILLTLSAVIFKRREFN